MESKYYSVLVKFLDYSGKAQTDLQGQFVLFYILVSSSCRGPPIARKNSS